MPIDAHKEGRRLVTLSEGNPGAISVLSMIVMQVTDAEVMPILDEIEKQELTGPKLWVAYKDHCRESVDQLVTGIMAHSPGMKNTLFQAGFTDFEWK